MEKLPIYEIVIDENDELTGVDFISLVDEPANDYEWIKFEKEKIFFKSDKKKKMIYGVFIVPDKKMYRQSESIGQYLTFFSKETIEKIVKKFNKNNYNKNINFQHGDNTVNGYVVENFITSDKIKVDFGFEVPDGSWVGSVYIEDEVFWNDFIETETLKGFSVEILSHLEKQDFLKFESYTDYPQEATENAQIALRWAEENGWGDCATQVGKVRANQLANREPISEDTISRMASFERHRQNSTKELGDGCGRLVWLSWGGDAGVEWAQRKLKQIKKENFLKLDSYTDYPKAATINAQKAINWAEKNGWGYCGTATSKIKAKQLANGEPINEFTISRMAAYARHLHWIDKPLGEGCAKLMLYSFGGKEGIQWAVRKLKQIRNEQLNEDEKYETMIEILNSDFNKDEKIDNLKNLFDE